MGVGERRSRKVQHPARSRDGCAVGRIWEPERTQCQRWGGIYRETRSFPLPMRRGGPVLGYPAVLTTSSILWGPGQGHFLGGFQVVDSGAGTESWDRSLRTPTCHRGHRQYLSSGPPYDFPRYRSTVHEVTQAFTAASREVLAVEAELTGPRQQPLLASHVRRLQQLEETRLATVRPRPAAVCPTLGLVSRALAHWAPLGGGARFRPLKSRPWRPRIHFFLPPL